MNTWNEELTTTLSRTVKSVFILILNPSGLHSSGQSGVCLCVYGVSMAKRRESPDPTLSRVECL